MKAGISLYSVPEKDTKKLIDFAINNDFHCVELWDDPFLLNHKKTISDYRLSISIHAPLLDIGSNESYESNLEVIKDSIQRAGSLEANLIVLHSGCIQSEIDSESAFKTAKRLIQNTFYLLEEYGILLCIENVGYLGNDLISTFNQLNRFVESFPEERVGIAFDIAHASISQDVRTGIHILRKRINHVHLSDSSSNFIHHLPLGKGEIDFSILQKEELDCAGILEITPDENWEPNILEGRKFLQKLELVR